MQLRHSVTSLMVVGQRPSVTSLKVKAIVQSFTHSSTKVHFAQCLKYNDSEQTTVLSTEEGMTDQECCWRWSKFWRGGSAAAAVRAAAAVKGVLRLIWRHRLTCDRRRRFSRFCRCRFCRFCRCRFCTLPSPAPWTQWKPTRRCRLACAPLPGLIWHVEVQSAQSMVKPGCRAHNFLYSALVADSAKISPSSAQVARAKMAGNCHMQGHVHCIDVHCVDRCDTAG